MNQFGKGSVTSQDKNLINQIGGKYLNTKLKSFNGKIITCFHGKKKHSKKIILVICLAAIAFYSVCRIKNEDDKYFPRLFWKSIDMKKRKQRKRPGASKKK